MDALKPFNSKYVTLTMRGGFFTKFATLAHGVPSAFRPVKVEIFNIDNEGRFLYKVHRSAAIAPPHHGPE